MKHRAIETDLQLKNLKPGSDEYRRTIGGGMYVVIAPNGSKTFRWDYVLGTNPKTGKPWRKTFTIGTYPQTSLADAKTARDDAREDVKAGVDPVKKKQQAAAVATETPNGPFFRDMAGAYKATRSGMGKSTVYRDKKMVEYLCDGMPEHKVGGFGNLKPDAVAYDHLYPMMRVSTFETRRRLIETAQAIVDYGRAHGMFPKDRRSPFDDVSASTGFAPHVTENRPAITDPAGFSELLRKVDNIEELATAASMTRRKLMRYGLSLLVLTFVRPGTLECAEWKEFHLDEVNLKGIWVVPFAKLKMRTERAQSNKPKEDFVVPLSRQAVKLLLELRAITGKSGYLFPGDKRPATGKRKASSGHVALGALNDALISLGYQGLHCAHGFRSTGSTMLNRERVNGRRRFETSLIEMQQDRLDASTRAIYDRDDRLPERIELMQFWADKVDLIRKGAVVLPLVA